MRKRAAKKRVLLPDPKFNDQLVTRFVNNLMWDGKKSVAFKVFYDALDIVEQKKQDEEKTSSNKVNLRKLLNNILADQKIKPLNSRVRAVLR